MKLPKREVSAAGSDCLGTKALLIKQREAAARFIWEVQTGRLAVDLGTYSMSSEGALCQKQTAL